MKKLALLFFAFTVVFNAQASDDEEAVQHLKVADVTSKKDAQAILIEKTFEIKRKKKLDQQELGQIHFITYTLEKGVAYYVENMKGERQELAEKLAEVVEEIHVSSENNRREETEKYLNEYFLLAEEFIAGF